jgi:hypothetical protein
MFPLAPGLALLLGRERIADDHRQADRRRRVAEARTRSNLRGPAEWHVRRHPTDEWRRESGCSRAGRIGRIRRRLRRHADAAGICGGHHLLTTYQLDLPRKETTMTSGIQHDALGADANSPPTAHSTMQPTGRTDLAPLTSCGAPVTPTRPPLLLYARREWRVCSTYLSRCSALSRRSSERSVRVGPPGWQRRRAHTGPVTRGRSRRGGPVRRRGPGRPMSGARPTGRCSVRSAS